MKRRYCPYDKRYDDKNRNATKYVASPRQRHAHEQQKKEVRNTNYTRVARCAAFADYI